MKKLSFIIILITALLFPTILAADAEKVAMEESEEATIQRRSVVLTPDVWIDSDINLLSVRFSDSNSVYTISIENEYGTVVYQDTFIADGNICDYFLSNIAEGCYTIFIENSNKSYRGAFII